MYDRAQKNIIASSFFVDGSRTFSLQITETKMSAAPAAGNKFSRPAKAPEDPVIKALKVKTGTLKRNLKDLAFAKAEVQREEQRMEKVAAEDPDKIMQQQNVIAESRMMIPLAENRIRTSLQDLKDYVADNDAAVADGEDKAAALAAINEAELFFAA